MWWILGLWILGVLGVGLATWGILSARVVLYPERRSIPPPHPLPSALTDRLTAPDGAHFEVWRLEATSRRARILLCHGYYANRFQVLDIAQGLRERGYEVVLFELRGHGDRPGPCTLGVKEAEDALTVLRWAGERNGGRPLPTGVLGLSMGAAVACQVAYRSPQVRAIVVDSIYSRLFPVLRRSLWRRYHLPTFPLAWVTWWGVQAALRARRSAGDPATLAPKLRLPLLAIQGGEDRRVTPLLGREFFRRWAGPKERWFEPQIAHVGMFAQHQRTYCDRVAAFFDRVLT